MSKCRQQIYNVVLQQLLLVAFLLAATLVRSDPITTTTCRQDTAELQEKNLQLTEMAGDLNLWTDELRKNATAVCTRRSEQKVTCVMDYVNATDSSDWCLDVPGALYLETTFIYKCENTERNKHNVFYSVKNRPACYAASCYDGYDTASLLTLEEETFEDLKVEFKRPNSNSEWGDIVGFEKCSQLRLEITKPIVYGQGTVSPAPTTTPAPTSSPTLTAAPTTTTAPTWYDEATCKHQSALIVMEGSIGVEKQGQTRSNVFYRNKVEAGLNKIHELMNVDTETGKGFEDHCLTGVNDTISNATNYCEFDYDEIIASTADNEDAIAKVCYDANGVYVEDSVSITCTSLQDNITTTQLFINNKPSCRSTVCNANEVRDMAITEFDRWMKLILEKGLEEAFAEDIDSDEGDVLPILNGPQSCVIDLEEDEDDEEGVLVVVGGHLFSDEIGEAVKPDDDCQAFNNQVFGNIQIYNQKSILQRAMIEYADTDLRQVCGSPKPNVLECNWDWKEIFPPDTIKPFTDAPRSVDDNEGQNVPDVQELKSLCMPNADASTNAGQYVENSFLTKCKNPFVGKNLTIVNTNVPGCVGRPCSPGQAKSLFQEDYLFLADFLIKDGWDCSTEVLSVYAPHFDPFAGTYDIADISFRPQDEAIVVDKETEAPEEEEEELLKPIDINEENYVDGHGNTDIANVPTQSPTESSKLLLRGPKFNVLLGNATNSTSSSTTSSDASDDLDDSSSTMLQLSRITTTLLLLIPLAIPVFTL